MYALCQCLIACMAACISVYRSPHAAACFDCAGRQTPVTPTRDWLTTYGILAPPAAPAPPAPFPK